MPPLKVLLFTTGESPDRYERQLAASIDGTVQFVPFHSVNSDALIPCDAVAGLLIPQQYKSKPSPHDAPKSTATTAVNAAPQPEVSTEDETERG